VTDSFDELLYSTAEWLVDSGCVHDVRILQAGSVVTGIVSVDQHGGIRKATQRVYIRRTNGTAEGECSCGERSPCVHVAAVSIAATRSKSEPAAVPHRAAIEPSLQRSANEPGRGAPARQQRLYYLLARPEAEAPGLRASGEFQVSLWVGQTVPGGERIQPDTACPFAPRPTQGSAEFPRYVDPQDRETIKALVAQRFDGPWKLHGEAGADLLRHLAATGRAFCQSLHGQALRTGKPREVLFVWGILPNGDQRLRSETSDSVEVILDVEPPMYIDSATNESGPLEPTCPLSLLRRYWNRSPISPEQAAQVNEELGRDAGAATFPRLRTLAVERQALSSLQAKLVLSADSEATLHFVYNGLPVDSRQLRSEQATVRQMAQGTLCEIDRDRDTEQRLQARLDRVLPQPGRETWLEFMINSVPALQAEGWELAVDPRFPYRIAEPDHWYGDLGTDRREGWFNLRLGVVVDGRPVNLLPALTRYLQTSLADGATDGPKDRALDDASGCRIGEQWLVRLDDGRYLPIALERIQRIANTLVELFDRDGLGREQALSLPAGQSGRLAQLSRELNGPILSSDDPSLRALIEGLEDFAGIRPLRAPAHFQATLRPYQEEGLGWLQFLRRYRLGGILADDMGLGKTVQTLAHLAMEKEQGRLRKPSLIVAPVSTLGNWQQEIRRFAPGLTGLTWHGNKRREWLPRLDQVDVIMTGYPLLQLDSEILLARDFYLVILDEAQMIKNPRARVSQVARALRAEYRLCLTGTPVENHLGELWSLFDFLQPGLLGEERYFQRHYRTPIEKNGDAMRAQALSSRLAPFLLRRTKDCVARELPPKMEIVEAIVLDERQRDFYDAIRLAMHRRVQEVVQQQGLARSQITILDALLKLRQACCDPRLIAVETAKADVPSAKLEWLSTVLPELVAEGRRILVFSQFTSMLRLIETAVSELSLPYCLLTGETQNRSAVIARFQAGAAPVFLISLKAGGTGLNLTAADTVIHYDPWWNPAVEAQATDRAHRIGQDKPVFVYKLIAQGTVEERMTQLQADKQALASQLYSASNASPASLGAADLELLFAP
jgi:superfamily II DNA or RNA helicase